jgi:hypothetical protein
LILPPINIFSRYFTIYLKTFCIQVKRAENTC